MLESSKLSDEYSHYDGSRTFIWLADMCGLSVDLINFLITQILALFLASFFRSFLHSSKVPAAIRHLFGLTVGLFFAYFCFGKQAIHIAGLPTLCYIVMRTQDPQYVQRLVMLTALLYLSCMHLLRQLYDYGSYAVDITGPLMIITQKVTSLAFSIHDGLSKDEKDLTKTQKYHAIENVPSALEFFSYVLHFQGLMAGPLVFYIDYIEFIEGKHILKHSANAKLLSNGKEIVMEPSPTKAIVKKVGGSLICAYIFMKFITVYPIKTIKDEDFLNGTTFIYKFWFIMMSTTVIRFKYYHAWLLADAICNNAGLGFNGYDTDGKPKWDMISNINVIPFELGTNMRDAINNWNMGTNRWLRNVVYERVPKKYATFLTFSLSALWHGFYPGYYLTFASGALIVMAARMARKLFRHRFQHTPFMRIFYDILTVIATRIFMGYATFPFVLYEFKASLRMYLYLYMCLHLASFVTIFLLPKFIRGEKRINTSRTTTSSASTSSTNLNSKDGIRNDDDDDGDNNNNNNDNDNNNGNAIVNEINCDKINRNTIDIIKNRNKLLIQNDINNTNNNNNINNNGILCNGNVKSLKNRIQNNNDNNNNNNNNVNNDDKENLSYKINEKIDIETKNIEDFIDKTVHGIVEFKDDLMRLNENELFITAEGMRKRKSENRSSTADNNNLINNHNNNIINTNNIHITNSNHNNNNNGNNTVDTFLRKEMDAINAAVQQANNVLPAVLSNGHAK